jgi:putative ABC transport system permease protein
LPQHAGEIVISEQFAQQLGVAPGETATLISATSTGSMAIENFMVVGTLRFGVEAMDRGAMFADISDIQYALDVADGAGEILGYFPNLLYQRQEAAKIASTFNARYQNLDDQFAYKMLTLRDQMAWEPISIW